MRREHSTRLERYPLVMPALLLSVLTTAATGQTWPEPDAAGEPTPIEIALMSRETIDHDATGPLPSAFGTQDQSIEILPSYTFGTLSDVGFDSVGDGYLWSPTSFQAGVQLPDGALVEAIEVEACDVVNDEQVAAGLFSCGPTASGVCDVVGEFIVTGVAEIPGCDRFGLVYSTPITVDNRNNTHFFSVSTSGESVDTSFRAARIFWRRQVSPAPATATFGDVPTDHPFFRHIEALVAAGITAGCGDGDFCPGDSLTRGQMAVFLAKALGLHWGDTAGD